MMSFTDTEYISKLDQAIQTSLSYLQPNNKSELEQELLRLREDKELLERKIQGYLTLSDICREYKEDLEKLKVEYNTLLHKVNCNTTVMQPEPRKSESPTLGMDPMNDLGMINGHDFAQRTNFNDPKNKSFLSKGSVASEILQSKRDKPVMTQELFEAVEDPPKSSEGHKSIPTGNKAVEIQDHPRLTHGDSFPMQESMTAEEHSLGDQQHSCTGLGFHNVTVRDLQMGPEMGPRATNNRDLMNFSLPRQSDTEKKARSQYSGQSQFPDDPDLDKLIGSLNFESVSDQPDIMTVMRKHMEKQDEKMEKYKRANAIIIQRNKTNEGKIKVLEEDNQQMLDRVGTLEREKYELSSRSTESPAPSQNGWVHVQKSANTKLNSTESISDIATLQQTNKQLLEANQRWSNEWNKLQEHFNGRIKELEGERDRLDKEKTDLKLAEDTKIRDYERMLMAAKKKREDEEAGKEEVLLQLTSANNKNESQQAQIAELQESVSVLRRDKHALETELSVVRQRPVTAASPPSATFSSDLVTDNAILRQQLLVFQEDFDRERQDRAKAQSDKDAIKKEVDKYKKRARHLEQKASNLERQLGTAEENGRKLQQEADGLRQQATELSNKLHQEQNRYKGQQQQQQMWAQPAMVQQPERRVLFGQVVQTPPQQRPQQFIVNPQQFDQNRVPHITGQVYNGPPALGQGQPAMQGGIANQPYYGPGVSGKQEYLSGAWSCNQCTYINYPGRTVCEVCGYIQSPSTNGAAFTYRNGSGDFYPRGEHQQQPVNQQQQQQYMFTPTPPGDLVMDARQFAT